MDPIVVALKTPTEGIIIPLARRDLGGLGGWKYMRQDGPPVQIDYSDSIFAWTPLEMGKTLPASGFIRLKRDSASPIASVLQGVTQAADGADLPAEPIYSGISATAPMYSGQTAEAFLDLVPRGANNVKVTATATGDILLSNLSLYAEDDRPASTTREITLTNLVKGVRYPVTIKTAGNPADNRSGIVTLTATWDYEGVTVIQSGQTISGISQGPDIMGVYAIDVPAGATQLLAETKGGTGDLAIFVQYGRPPTENDNNLNDGGTGTPDESYVEYDPRPGRWYVGLWSGWGYTFENTSLTVTLT